MNYQNFHKWFPKLERLDTTQLQAVADKVKELTAKVNRKKVFSKAEFEQLLNSVFAGKVPYDIDEDRGDDSVSVHFEMFSHDDDDENYYEEPNFLNDDY